MSRSLHAPSIRHEEKGSLWKLLPFLAGALVIALIWAERRSRHQGHAAMGTAPAGAPPMRERDTAPFRAPGPTARAEAGPGTVARQPAPVAEADAPVTSAPEQLATAGPDMAQWVNEIVSDTGGGDEGQESAAGTATGEPAGEPEASAAGDSAHVEIPTPAAETTAVGEDEGTGWIQANGVKTCPEEFPIKGNASSRIYHLPGESTYEATIPEICFATEEAAVGLGYRARKR